MTKHAKALAIYLSAVYQRQHGWLHKLFKICATCFVLGNALLWLAIDNTPLVQIREVLTREDIERVKQLMYIPPNERDQIKTISLNLKDINLASRYFLDHLVENATQIDIIHDYLYIQVAVFVPKTFWGQYLDFCFKLIQDGDKLRFKSFKIGEISIPDPSANVIFPWIIEHSPYNRYYELLGRYIKNIEIRDNHLNISYSGGIIDAAKTLLAHKNNDYPHLSTYQQQISDIAAKHDPAWRLSLAELVQPLFAYAYAHSDETTAIQENRTVLIAIATYIYKRELRAFMPVGLIFNKEYPVYAYKRVDVPQHFIASALITAIDSSIFSAKLGIDKELGDAESGSGFSFVDLNSDKSGSKFGQMAIASPQSARELQRRAAETSEYQAFIPDIQGLPEHMDEAEFAQRFQQIGSPAYNAQVAEIEQRIRALPFYQSDQSD
jgi:hypothetical protein